MHVPRKTYLHLVTQAVKCDLVFGHCISITTEWHSYFYASAAHAATGALCFGLSVQASVPCRILFLSLRKNTERISMKFEGGRLINTTNGLIDYILATLEREQGAQHKRGRTTNKWTEPQGGKPHLLGTLNRKKTQNLHNTLQLNTMEENITVIETAMGC